MTQSPSPQNIFSVRYVKYVIKAVLILDVFAEIPAMLNNGERLELVRTRATGDMSLFVSYDNRQSSRGFNSNSIYGEAYHQMFMLQIKE